jgi:hypothetical protein
MKRFLALVGVAALVVSACGAGASPAVTQAPATPTAAPSSTPAPTAAATAATVTARVTFDGDTCAYEGPVVVETGTRIVWVFENTPAAIEASTEKGAKSIGSDLVIIPTVAGTTLEILAATQPAPEGTKGDWGVDAATWGDLDHLVLDYGPTGTKEMVADGNGYYVGCFLYWNYETGVPMAFYNGALIQVLEG